MMRLGLGGPGNNPPQRQGEDLNGIPSGKAQVDAFFLHNRPLTGCFWERLDYTFGMLARLHYIWLVFLSLLVAGEQDLCAQLEETFLETDGVAKKHSRLFRPVDVSGAGIEFVHRWNPPAKHRDQLTNAFSGAGVAAARRGAAGDATDQERKKGGGNSRGPRDARAKPTNRRGAARPPAEAHPKAKRDGRGVVVLA